MKRLLLIGLLLFGVGQVSSFAQNDDIYFNSSDIEKQKREDKKRAEEEARLRAQEEDRYSSSGNRYSEDDSYQSYNRSYENDGYADYDNDYSYASRINRFNYPFYNRGYWSVFYNPFWYDPFWYDPYWGWSPWSRPGFSISIGIGPYWNSYWGWYNWYGYPAYGSYWNYPYYGGWYGNPYYSGYWNGYYAGLYHSGAGLRTVNYGPRHSPNAANNNSVRRTLHNTSGASGTVNAPSRPRMASPENNVPNRVNPDAAGRGARSIDNSNISDRATGGNNNGNADRPARRVFSRDENATRYNNNDAPSRNIDLPSRPMNEHRGIYDRSRIEDRSYQAPPRQEPVRQRMEQPRYEQRRMEQPRYEQPSQPRFEQRSQPRFESPRMSSPRMSSPSPAPSSSPRGGGGFGGRR